MKHRLLIACLVACAGIALAQKSEHALYEPIADPVFRPEANVLLKAKVAASPHWSRCAPQLAVDGKHRNPGGHWAAENIPVHLTVELPQPKPINAIRFWPYWGDGRYYQYLIEGSVDGKTWKLLADRRDNTAPGSAAGQVFHFDATSVRFVRTTFTHNSAGKKTGGHIVEIEAYQLPGKVVAAEAERLRVWSQVPDGLQGGFGSLDVRYPRDQVPAATTTAWAATAWRGERVAAQLVCWSKTDAKQLRVSATQLVNPTGQSLPASALRTRFVRYVLSKGALMPDVLDPAPRLDLAPCTVRAVWVSVAVPAGAQPGRYKGKLVARAAGAERTLDVSIDVLPLVLPPPSQWSFHLDLWQNPYAVARYHRVEPWCAEHDALLRPHLRLLASAGQKCITTTILHDPWNSQTYDPYESMVEWIRGEDGQWRFDFTAFDHYVELCQECGVGPQISCYSMVAWNGRIRCLDAKTGEYGKVYAKLGTPEHEALWRPFLAAFTAHLKAKGWLERTCVAMDEIPLKRMLPFIEFVKKAAPGLKLALAGGNHPELKDAIHDWCVFISPPLDPAIARERIARSMPTTFYVCCGPRRPNTFTFSPPAEAAWLGWYAAAQGYSGFLRWAYDCYTQDPLYETHYPARGWPAGDCFVVYPGARSSIRFERLREGIQDYEKIRLVRAALAKRADAAAVAARKRLDAALGAFTYASVRKQPAAGFVNSGKAALEAASRLVGPGVAKR